jgi:hypothetical protein
MKKILLTVCTLVGLVASSFAQNLPIDPGTGKVTYLEVVDATGVSNADMLKVAKEWGLKQGYTIKEETADKIIFNGSSNVEYPGVNGSSIEKGQVTFTASVFVKDGKYRYIFTDFVHVGDVKTKASGGKLENINPDCGATKMSSKSWVLIKNKTASIATLLTNDLKRVEKEFQNNPANKSDW